MAVFNYSSTEALALTMSPGESLKPLSPTSQSPIRLTDLPLQSFKSKLPPAVANVPADHIRGYVHNKKVNHYLVGSNLGEGSFAKVKEAFHVLVGEKVAMKVIDKKKALQDPYVAKNFRREAKLLQMVRHSNILQLLEVIETDSSFYLITELCSGGELMKYIYKKGQLDENEARKFMRQIVSAVDHMHKAGIIHRDLKVENMLLDANMDIKIIDFGLSNEEFVQGENGLQHCATQCGSPAYAAPELLGHKAYGPQVDIWSIGVNMYAMLTGCLPYTVEPFNITALHAKMLENKMNPIPESLSQNCKDMLKQLLKSNPDERMKMAAIMTHPWMNEGHTLPFGPAAFPNKLQSTDVSIDILQHMVYYLKIKDSEEEMKQELVSNRSTHSGAVYHLLTARLSRYKKHFHSHPTRVHRSRVSRDQGYYEGPDDDDDHRSIVSMPITKMRRPTRQGSRAENLVPLRYNRPGAGKDRPISHPLPDLDGNGVLSEEEDRMRAMKYHSRRRQTMPEMMLKDDLAKFQAMRRRNEMIANKKEGRRPATRQNPGTSSEQRQKRVTPPSSEYNPHPEARHKRTTPPNNKEFDYANPRSETAPNLSSIIKSKQRSNSDSTTNTTLAPVHPTPHHSPMKRNTYSNPAVFKEIRDEFASKLDPQGQHGSGVMQAWRSNPSSRNQSRNPSRQGSRQPSSTMRRANSNLTIPNRSSLHEDDLDDDQDNLRFHSVGSHTIPRAKNKIFTVGGSSESINDSTVPSHLPAITERDSFRTRHYSEDASTSVRKNGYMAGLSNLEVRTELGVEEVMREIARVANSLKIREMEQTSSSSAICVWGEVKLQVSVSKADYVTCRLNFQWLAGGDLNQFREKRDKLFKRLKL